MLRVRKERVRGRIEWRRGGGVGGGGEEEGLGNKEGGGGRERGEKEEEESKHSMSIYDVPGLIQALGVYYLM